MQVAHLAVKDAVVHRVGVLLQIAADGLREPLLPQAGVALGMSHTAAAQLGTDGGVIRSITLFSVLIYELVGPLLTKIALDKAGEIKEKPVPPRKQAAIRNISIRRNAPPGSCTRDSA